jgi:predicted dehydrogenase
MEKNQTNFGVIGISGRGSGMLAELLSVEGVKVTAVCDKYEDRAQNGVKIVQEKAGNTPDMYLDYKELLARKDISAILCCTTWITHSRIAIDAMRAGKHVAFEVGGAASTEECWQMVRASEETGKFCMILENCCYDRNELALYNMTRLGLFGEIIHTQGGYQHDLRDEITFGRETRHGRLFNFMNRNGDLYPTHQLGPIAKLLNINRGNRFVSLTSMASKARGLHEGILDNMPKGYDLSTFNFAQGDIVTTMIKCAHGETILLIHDCTLPRPYSRNYRVQGTKGIYMEDKDQIYIEDESPQHCWDSFEPYRNKYEHPLWKQYAKDGIHAGGHGGMDYLVLSAFAESAINDVKSPIDVYDTAAWMAITCLSEQSIAMGSMPVPVPDFTNGMWIDREPYRRGKYCLEEVCNDYFE